MKKITLGVNIDHIAVLREARKVNDPDILYGLYVACSSGADQITIHLREDRRHIQDRDAKAIIQSSPLPVNLECSINEEILDIVCELKPHRATLVPEKREEVTTEGGLDTFKYEKEIQKAIKKLHKSGIEVSLFVDPNIKAMKQSKTLGAEMVELHTGSYSNIFAMLNSSLPYTNYSVKELEIDRDKLKQKLKNSIKEIKASANYAKKDGLKVAAGHGLNYHNLDAIKNIKAIEELNIGQSIIAKSVFIGLADAVKEMKSRVQR